MKYIDEYLGEKIPKFTDKEKMIIMYFLENDNEPTYPSKISKSLKNRISKHWAIKLCRLFEKEGLMEYKQIKPPRQKNKTEWFYIKNDFNTFLRISYDFLFSNESIEKLKFIQTKYVQKLINENLIRIIFYYMGVYIKNRYSYNELSISDQNRYYKAYKKWCEENEGKCELFLNGITKKESDKLRKKTPNIKIISRTGIQFSIRFPILPNDLEEKEKEDIFNDYNKEHFESDNLYKYSIVRKYYELESKELHDFLEKYLILIQISPNALKDLLFFDMIYPNKLDKNIDNILQRIEYLYTGGIDTKILPILIIDTIFDLAKTNKLPKDSIVQEARVLPNPQNTTLTEPSLKLVLKKKKWYSFSLSFVLNKEGIKSFHFDTGKVSK
jgi:hypothetical protein